MIKTLFLIRHGEKIRMVGDPALTERGELQAKATGVFLAAQNIHLLMASPLLRTQQTAQAISEACGLPVQTETLLRERANWGDDPSQSFEEFVAMWNKSSQDRAWQPPVGDSAVTAGSRLRFVIENLMSEHERVVLVSHGGTIGDFLFTVFTAEELDALKPGFSLLADGMVKECSVTELTFDSESGSYELHQLVNTDHLMTVNE